MIEGDYIKTPNFHITMGKLCVDNQGNPAISVKFLLPSRIIALAR